MKKFILFYTLLIIAIAHAQIPVSLPKNPQENETKLNLIKDKLEITWPTDNENFGQIILDLNEGKPLFSSINMGKPDRLIQINKNLDPVFMLDVGKRILKPENGWTIFFDKVPTRPYKSYVLDFNKKNLKIIKKGTRTLIQLGELSAPDFNGSLEITIYNNSPLYKIAAVVSTQKDSTAILYDAGLVGDSPWANIAYADPFEKFNSISTSVKDTATVTEVRYRTIMGGNDTGALAVFPAPHQYFYPLDEAFNLSSVWHGTGYRGKIKGYGIGIRQDPNGDHRYVPWFNCPPNTAQQLSFFCLLGNEGSEKLLKNVKKFTHGDRYAPLKGYKTMASHFHNEFIMNVVMAGKKVPEKPEFVQVFKKMGVNIVHLAEFHYTAHPKGPDSLRLKELHALFKQTERLSDDKFLLLPGEEPNEFFGGHWLDFFPKPIYWIMSREEGAPFITQDSLYGKVYHIGNKDDMLKLLKDENGLAWTAHPRIKGSTGFPDTYKNEGFFKSDYFLGGAWKAMPADLSKQRLGTRVLNLMDDMNNWGYKKKVVAEADLFSITLENEMYAHMNINYLKLDRLPDYSQSWQTILNAMKKGNFFSTTGEILIPSFSVNGKEAGETVDLTAENTLNIQMKIDWTFPLNFAEIISGDGKNVFHDKIDLSKTKAFGAQQFDFSTNLKNKKWVRLEIWDIAGNGAFTQTVYLNN